MTPDRTLGGRGMHGENRVAWREGLFLRPQHFQQQDRHAEALIRARTDTLRPFAWGLTELKINHDLAMLGKFAVERCRGVLPDGQPFAIPDDLPPPPPLDVPGDARDAEIKLTLPARQASGAEFRDRAFASEATRFVVDEEDSIDAFADEQTRETIEIALPNLRFGITDDQTMGRVCLSLARVREVHNGRLVLDERFIPACLDVRANERLAGFLSDILGRARQRVDGLSLRAVEATDGGSDTFASFLLLMALNRWTPALKHLSDLPMVHPERLFEAFVGMAGELATMTRADRQPPAFPAYAHDKLQLSFEPVVEALIAALLAVFDRAAIQLPLENPAPGVYVSPITDRLLYQTGTFFLAVRARSPSGDLRRDFPRLAKLGSILRIQDIIRGAAFGISIGDVATPPPQIRVLPGYVYFELDRSKEAWKEVVAAPALAMQVADDWPDLSLELWCVKARR